MTGAAIFDLDGTLARGDTFLPYLLGRLRRAPVRWHRMPELAAAVALFQAGRRSNAWLKSAFLRAILGGDTRGDLAPFTAAFVDRLVRTGLRRQGLAVLAEQRAAGRCIVLATASPDLYVEPLAARLGVDRIVCTRLAYDSAGRITGGLDGANCHGAEKRARIEQLVARQVLPRPLHVFSDHHADLPLFALADHGTAVCPTRPLQRAAPSRGLTVAAWR